MSKLSIREEVGRISWDSKELENPFAIKPRGSFSKMFENEMHLDELRDDRDGHYEGSPVGGWK